MRTKHTKHTTSQSTTRFDVYQTVTNRIIELLEKGVVPWESPSRARVGMPRNFSTGKTYRGINVFLLGCHEFQSPYFLTFIQAKELGGNVRKGEKGFMVVKYGTYSKEEDGAAEGEANPETRHFLKAYTVFNACQIDGIEFPTLPACSGPSELEGMEAAQAIIDGMPNPPAMFEGRKAHPHYVPATDTVEMPSRESFVAPWRFFKTYFHELTHSAGAAHRLARKTLLENRGIDALGESRKIYSQEELVAEMGAAFLAAHAGITEDGGENSAAYLSGWLSVLKVSDHKTWLVKAASEAQKAADYILGITPDYL